MFTITNTSGSKIAVTVTMTNTFFTAPAHASLNFTSFVNSYSTTGIVPLTTVLGEIYNYTNGSPQTFSPVYLCQQHSHGNFPPALLL